jgi:cytochrome c biogenesis protein CcdA
MPSLEGVSAAAAQLFSLLPVGYAFLAGMLATMNPCGFAMLPAYIGYYLGLEGGNPAPVTAPASALGRGWQGLKLGGTVTAGFVALFLVAGLLVQGVSRSLSVVFPWVGAVVGVGLVVLGLFWLRGGGFTFSGIKLPKYRGLPGFFLFGVAYALVSLSCTLPIFLAVVATSFATSGTGQGLYQMVSYGLGMGAVVTAVTLSAALFQGALTRKMRRVLPYVHRASAGLLLLAGLYIVYWSLFIGVLR